MILLPDIRLRILSINDLAGLPWPSGVGSRLGTLGKLEFLGLLLILVLLGFLFLLLLVLGVKMLQVVTKSLDTTNAQRSGFGLDNLNV